MPLARRCSGDSQGRTLHDSYILGEVLGRGVTSSVYKCLFKGKKECACKILNKSLLDRRRLECELPELMELRHPNLIEFRDVLDNANEVTLIMELASGGELLERIAEKGYHSEQSAAEAFRQILGAIQCLHAGGHTHRALRPEKFVFSSESDDSPIKVLSVGLAEPRLLPNAVPYCAPEAGRGKEGTPASDMWSLGVMLYILLCGFEPFVSEGEGQASSAATGHYHLHFPGPWWDDVSDSARDLVSKLLQTDASARLTADQALEHPWVRGDNLRTHHMVEAVRSLREFNARRKFRAATQAVVATQRLVSPEKRMSRVLGLVTAPAMPPTDRSSPGSPSPLASPSKEAPHTPTRC